MSDNWQSIGSLAAKVVAKQHFRRDLMCSVDAITYDFKTRIGRLHMPEGDCCDMRGCVGFFRSIDPDVRRIQTLSGGVVDTAYYKSGNSWIAEHPSPRRDFRAARA